MAEPTPHSAKTTRATSEAAPRVRARGAQVAGLLTATIDIATGKIVALQSVDAAGATSELTTDRRADLSEQTGGATLEDLFEHVFEAGIVSVLGDDDDIDDDEMD